MKTYKDQITAISTAHNVIVTLCGAVTAFKTVSKNSEDLQNNYDYPVCVVRYMGFALNSEIREKEAISAQFEIILKDNLNHETDILTNTGLIFEKLEDYSLTHSVSGMMFTGNQIYYDTVSSPKTVISVIPIEIEIK